MRSSNQQTTKHHKTPSQSAANPVAISTISAGSRTSLRSSASDEKDEVEGEEMTGVREDAGDALIDEEERQVGAVALATYQFYMKAGGGYIAGFVAFLFLITGPAGGSFAQLWVSIWVEDNQYEDNSLEFYIFVYGGISLAMALMTGCAILSVTLMGVRASRRLNHALVNSILNAPMAFFDTTPTGRITSRFAKDMSELDADIP